MGTRYNIVVTATDAATARVQAIKKSIGSIVSPITNVGKSVKALGQEVGLKKIGSGLTAASKGASNLLRTVGALNPAIAGIGAGASLVGAVVALGGYTKEMIYAQSATLRFSQVSGVAATKVQTLRGAAQQAGLSADDMDGAIMNMGNTLQDARWGRNQGALMMMNRLGMRMKFTKDGAIDTKAGIEDLADVIHNMNAPVQTKALVAAQFGQEALLPILLKGKKAMQDFEAAAAAIKPPLTDEELKRADEYRKKIDAMKQSFDSIGQSFSQWSMPALGDMADFFTAHNKQVAANIKKMGFFGAIGHGIVQTGKDVGGYIPNKISTNVKDIGNLISAGEGGYNSVNLGKAGGYKSARTNLVESSIDSIMKAQAGGDFNAAGKYQMTKGTLRDAVKALHLDTSQKFDQATQERIFKDYLLRMKRPEIADYLNGKTNDLHGAVKAASKEWASIADPDTGQSHYAGVGNNKSSIPADAIAASLKAARDAKDSTDGPAKRYVVGSDKAAEAALAGQGLPGVWQGGGKSAAPDPSTLHIVLTAPPGTQANIVDQKGPVKTTLKQESSMPDYNL